MSHETDAIKQDPAGCACITGSHKANIEVPSHMRDLSKFVHPTIKPVPAKAGDCIIFT